MDQPEMISGPPTPFRLWVGVTSPSLAASIALERSLWTPLRTENVGVCLFGYEMCRPCSGQLWPCEVQRRLLERLSKGYLGAYLWESGIRGQDIENCLKAERRSGVAVLAISAMQNCLTVYESLKIDEVLNLHGKQIGHVLGCIPGAVWASGSARNEPSSQGVLEEANRRIVGL